MIKTLVLAITLGALPLAQAEGNRDMHCQSARAELFYHTEIYGSVAVADSTVYEGVQAELTRQVVPVTQPLEVQSHGLTFRVARPGQPEPMFLVSAYGHVLERGTCRSVEH